jgi:transcriptional regulator with XRE-family HTH domain
MPDPASAFAANLKQMREGRGWTQHELAARSGISVGTIGNLEGGRNGVGLNRAWVLAKAVGGSLDEMCEDGPYARGETGRQILEASDGSKP